MVGKRPRIDERVKMLVEQHAEACDRIDKLMDKQEGIMTRVSVLETKDFSGIRGEVNDLRKSVRSIEAEQALIKTEQVVLKNASLSHQTRWEKAADWGFKIVLAVLSAFLAWKMAK